MIKDSQLPDRYRAIIDEQVAIFDKKRSITKRNSIPDTADIPLDNQVHWLKIPSVICVYADMLDSTKLSADSQDQDTAGAYQLYTGTAVRVFHEFDAGYIDVRGDGAFALFDADKPHTALAAAVTFKTFASSEFRDRVKKLSGVVVGSHLGIDQKVVLVRKIGLRRNGGRTDHQNEVWAGKPVNMAAKLASLSKDDELLVSDRFLSNFSSQYALKSCGCVGGSFTGERSALWTERDLDDDDRFDFDKCYSLVSKWCPSHGNEYCEKLLGLD
jgi:class 3 adenylate cyclase